MFEKELEKAKKNLERIRREREDQQRNSRIIEAKITLAESSARKDAEDAVFEGRKPNTGISAEIQELRKQLMEADGSVEVYQRAEERAESELARIDGEVKSHTLQIQRTKFEPAIGKFFAAVNGLMEASANVRRTLEECGEADLEAIFFPMRNPGAAGHYTHRVRAEFMSAFNVGFNLLKLKEADLLKERSQKDA
jgi:chromosome segregation ATPase